MVDVLDRGMMVVCFDTNDPIVPAAREGIPTTVIPVMAGKRIPVAPQQSCTCADSGQIKHLSVTNARPDHQLKHLSERGGRVKEEPE